MISEQVTKLIELFLGASPALWEIGMRYAYTQVFLDAVLGIVFVFPIGWVRRWRVADDFSLVAAKSLIVMLLVVVVAVFWCSAIGILANPEYYALKYLLQLVGIGV